MAKVQTAGGTPFIYIPTAVVHSAQMQQGDIWEFTEASPTRIILVRSNTNISPALQQAKREARAQKKQETQSEQDAQQEAQSLEENQEHDNATIQD